MSWYQKGKTNLDFNEARDSEWQWHLQLGHMQVCTSLQTDNHASIPPLSFYRPDALPAAQPTVSKHWLKYNTIHYNKSIYNAHAVSQRAVYEVQAVAHTQNKCVYKHLVYNSTILLRLELFRIDRKFT